MRRVILWAAMPVLLLKGQASQDSVYRIGSGVSPPVPIHKTEPKYSEEARQAKYQGTVVLSLVVSASGVPTDIKVIRPIGLGLDEQAIAAVETWRFRPGQKDGVSVAVMATIEVNFRLPHSATASSGPYWFMSGISYDLEPASRPPRPIEFPLDGLPALSSDARFQVRFNIGIDGHPRDVDVDWTNVNARSVAEQIGRWTFEPAQISGSPISARARMTLLYMSGPR